MSKTSGKGGFDSTKASGRKTASRKGKLPQANSSTTTSKRTGSNSGPISFFIAMIIILLGSVELVSTFHSYAMNLSELNGLRKQEASLVEQKRDLENQIARWNDSAYVTAQARERLGFVFPGEEAVRVLHPEAVTGSKSNDSSKSDNDASTVTTLPWYSELSYSFAKADKQAGNSASKKQTSSSSPSANSGASNKSSSSSSPSSSSSSSSSSSAAQ